MRLFEGLLLLVNLPVIIWSLRRPRWLNWLPGTAVLLTVIHLIFEGYRWQMIPAHALTGLLAVLILARRGKEASPRRLGLAHVRSHPHRAADAAVGSLRHD